MPRRTLQGRVSVHRSPTGCRSGFWEDGKSMGYYWAGPDDDVSPFDIHPFTEDGLVEAESGILTRGHIKFAIDCGPGVYNGTSMSGHRDGLLKTYEWVRRQVWEWNVKLAARGHLPPERMLLKEEDVALSPYVRRLGAAVIALVVLAGGIASLVDLAT